MASLGFLVVLVTGTPWVAVVRHGAAGILVAALVHFLYTRAGFVERADSAASVFLAWVWMVGQLVFVAPETAAEAWQSDIGALVMLWAWWPALRIQRQPSTAHLGFVAGALTGLACLLAPGLWGAMVGLVLVQILTRSFQFRELALLVIGWVWPVAMAWVWGWLLADGPSAFVEPNPFLPSFPGDFAWKAPGISWGAGVFGGVWMVWGLAAMLRRQSGHGLTTQITRRNVFLLLWTTMAGSVCWDGLMGAGGLSATTWATFAVSAGFSGSLMVPDAGRPFDGMKRRRQATMLAVVGLAMGLAVGVWLSQIA